VANPVQALQVKDVLEIIWEETKTPLRSSEVPIWKRGLDIACILIALPAVVVLFSLIAVWIKLASRGPVLFRQERVGLGGRTFVCLKFRSMKVGADTNSHKDYLKRLLHSETPMTKMDVNGDPRLIPLGALLRSTGLDELPQLINVLRGDMSLVGPRPCIPYEAEDYLPWQKERFDTLPGLTGLWQVSGKNRTTFNEMIKLDIAYAREKSLWLDVKIIAKTIPALISQVRETRAGRKTPLVKQGRAIKVT
jgi:lipopolysaccharide/colanic/teichoic acid biosynthesis glycosyltransferase